MSDTHSDPRRPKRAVALTVSGFHCTNCALSLEKHLTKLGVGTPTVDFTTGRTSFELHEPDTLPSIIRSIQQLGYGVSDESIPRPVSRSTALHYKTAISALLTAPLFFGMFFHVHALHEPFVQFLLATPVFCIGLTHFGMSGWRSLRAGAASMDLLITAGILSGYIASVTSMVLGLGSELIFFEAVASIVTFILIGHLLEERAVKKTTSAIEELSTLHPKEANRLSVAANGARHVEIVPLTALEVDDMLQVNTGDRIPTDGIIESGTGSIDESMLTGESLPVEKGTGDTITGGTLLLSGSLVMRAKALGDDTVLASIVRLVREATTRRPQIQRIGDAVSSVFVPAVLLCAIGVFVVSIVGFHLGFADALVRALAIVVVACPCAMGLATPTAIMVALGRAAQSGILIRGGDTLERCAQVQHVAFDKTGTLTLGELTVGELHTHNGFNQEEAKALLVALQRGSSHPIAKSIVRAFQSTALPPVSLVDGSETRGIGVSARDEHGATYVCGGRRTAQQNNLTSDDDIVLLKDGELIASLQIRDTVRPEAREAVAALSALGISTSLISGDTTAKCRELAHNVGITQVYAEQTPEDKVHTVRNLLSHHQVAYVGDGINDAPSLSEASVGISLGSASDIAIQSAQVILTGKNLSALVHTLQLARITVRTIRQNLFWAFFYNIAAIPLAACGYISPLAGALLMTLSDVVIVGNSLRIRYRSLS